jgi:hypothetical protein
MSVADYLGRQVDALAFPGAEARGMVPLEQELASEDNSGQICVGVQKLAQKFLLALLTELGTMPYQRERGTQFLTEARLGRWQTELDVTSSFTLALADIERQLVNDESDSTPDDERFGSAELRSLVLTSETVQLTIVIRSRSGLSRRVILPIPFLV